METEERVPLSRLNSYQNYFSIATIAPRSTDQSCLLCFFPLDLLHFFVAQVKLHIDKHFQAARAVPDPTGYMFFGYELTLTDFAKQSGNSVPKLPPEPSTRKLIANSDYLAMLHLKLGLLSLMSSCYDLYKNTRGMVRFLFNSFHCFTFRMFSIYFRIAIPAAHVVLFLARSRGNAMSRRCGLSQ
jgi:hypothetical protein